jgi:hypothetical protein
MLGTAGAYGYRTYYALPGAQEPPPVITADNTTPTKVVPAPTIDPPSSKAMDRLATAVGNEQLVRRQEEPVALKELGTAATPRVVLPAPGVPGQTTSLPQPQNSPAAAAPNSSEPKRVRTVTIRPDGSDVSARPVGAPSPQAKGAANPSAAPTPPAPRATPTPTRGGGPISLDPQTPPSETGTVPPPARARTATAPAAQATPEAANASASGYLVQLSSQRSESEAQSAYRSLQSKFPAELGTRQPVIRRADLGNKGVYYRTMVGPFRTAQEASQFCASYKAAGGQCVVPSN